MSGREEDGLIKAHENDGYTPRLYPQDIQQPEVDNNYAFVRGL